MTNARAQAWTIAVLGWLLVAACGGTERAAVTPTVTVSRTEVPIGGPIEMRYRFQVAPDAPALATDHLVFVHFLDVDGELMWTDDHPPETPTRAWTPGATIEYSRTMFLPAFPYVGRVSVVIGIYDPASGGRVPMDAVESGRRAYEVATFETRLADDRDFVAFATGWHPTESSEDGSRDWQWSQGTGTIAFANPRQDATLYLELDAAAGVFETPQEVVVRIGEAEVDRFALPAGAPVLRAVPVRAAQLGDGSTVEVVVAVDRTFVPASVPALQSSDPRELGVRVFRAHLAPKN